MEEAAEFCIANIGPGERRKRMMVGMVFGVVTLAAAGAAVGLSASLLLRLLVFLPAWMAGLGYFQARSQT
jgi:hypothetical protein